VTLFAQGGGLGMTAAGIEARDDDAANLKVRNESSAKLPLGQTGLAIKLP
jgi:hypothetical protein